MSTPDTTAEVLGLGMRAAAAVVRGRLGRDVSLVVGAEPQSAALLRFDVQFTSGEVLSWFVSNEDATGFSDVLIGGSGDRAAVLTEMHLDALSGVFSEMLEASVEGMNSALGDPLAAGGVDMGMETALPALEPEAARVSFVLDLDGFGPLAIAVQTNGPLGMRLAAAHLQAQATEAPPEMAEPAALAEPAIQPTPAADNVVALPTQQSAHAPASSPLINPAARGDLRMLLNVPLQVTVELGRAQRTVRDLLDLNVGSILELDKLAGDPMDIMVNGRVLARGEVVVIDEEFGVRITEIVDPEQRVREFGS